MVKYNKSLYWIKLVLLIALTTVIAFHFTEVGKIEKFGGVFGTVGMQNNTINKGQITVMGKNNRIHNSWLPHQNGNIYLRPDNNKDVFIGDTNTKNIKIGTSPNLSSVQVGNATWLPYKDGNMYLRPYKKNGIINIGDIQTNDINLGGNEKISSVRVGPRSYFPSSDGNTYIRPGRAKKEIVIGDTWTNRVILGGKTTPTVIRGRLDLKDEGDNSDSYHLEKISNGKNNSHLRLTLKDDANESFQIWGDSCRKTGCTGPGVRAHQFTVDGRAIHMNSICIDDVCIDKAQMQKLKRL